MASDSVDVKNLGLVQPPWNTKGSKLNYQTSMCRQSSHNAGQSVSIFIKVYLYPGAWADQRSRQGE